MGFLEDSEAFAAKTDTRLDAIEKIISELRRNKVVDPEQSGALSTAMVPWHAQEDQAYVVITAGPLGDGYFTARRQMANPSRQMIDDEEMTEELKVYAAAGATLFKGAAGFVRYSGLIGTPPEPLWLTSVGEWNGFLAKLTDAPDADEAYAWTQVGTAPFRPPLTNTSGGASPLGRALDYSHRARDPDLTSDDRASWLANTPHLMRWDPVAQRMFFYGRREALSEECSPP